KGIPTIVCNTKHMPNGLLLPLAAHSRYSLIIQDQLAMSKPLKKRLWQKIIIQKIQNQAIALDLLHKNSSDIRQLIKKVISGDSTNRESVAANKYFKTLIPEGTRRASDYTAPLDYGYAILRAGIARTLVSGGWLVSIGIKHSNTFNELNLVDDFIEPFRPCVDYLVFKNDIKELNTHNKHILTSIFEQSVQCGNEHMAIQQAIEKMTYSFKQAVTENDPQKLLLPILENFSLESIE
ncbi:MAG: type II CRISPR-associated endonuclease Cas1, partial [Actinomycetaceae bacterium]|nr:type II CRISPR-associated endonuclease Cas1 [Actinomycetaceae bacterium]